MDQDNSKDRAELTAFQREIWAERVDVPPRVLDQLIHQHQAQMLTLVMPMLELSEGAMLEDLGGILVNGENDWYIAAHKGVNASVARLSKGFKMSTEALVPFFRDDNYIGSDIRDILQNPQTKPHTYPTRDTFACQAFIKAALPYISEPVIAANPQLTAMADTLEFVGACPWNALQSEMSPLRQLFEAQSSVKTLSAMNQAWGTRYANLITVGQCFKTRLNIIADEIIAQATAGLRPG